ncbi:MAG TPA: DUF4468 domain-containing protein [Hymenobacter sp.]|jgi:hypothetical protein|uniref:DUF4468 domain-containing protein n=1 Tax=Hymenobacter sp. TaxID=1898978 RepID=UPI002ED92E91
MNKLLTLGLLACLLGHEAAAQSRPSLIPNLPSDSLTHRIKFVGVVAVPGASAAELQARAREWLALTFQDAREVVQLDDATRGVLIGRGYTRTIDDPAIKKNSSTEPLSFTLRLDFRDGRYRYEVFDLGRPVSSSGASELTSQFSDFADWQFGGLATVAASRRQELFQPDLSMYPTATNVAEQYGRRWPDWSVIITKTVMQLMNSLRQHETAKPAKW